MEGKDSLSFVSDIRQICQPMFDIFGINYFDYARIYKNGEGIFLYSDPEWVEYFLNHPKYIPPCKLLPEGRYIWHSYFDDNFLSVARNEFSHEHGVTLVRNTNHDYDELINFSADPKQKQVYNLYINQTKILDHFINYFLDKVNPFINTITRKRLLIDNNKNVTLHEDSWEEKYQKFCQFTSFSPLKSQVKLPPSIQKCLSTREEDSIKHLLQGLSAKEIARQLNISHRTVEQYLDSARQKLNCKSRIELICCIAGRALI